MRTLEKELAATEAGFVTATAWYWTGLSSRSRWAMGALPPWKATSAQPRSSAIIKTKFGGFSSIALGGMIVRAIVIRGRKRFIRDGKSLERL